MPAPRLLIVDDEAAQMKALCQTLETEGYVTVGFTSATEALEALREHAFDVVLTDLMMPEMSGIALLQHALAIDPDVVGVVMTGHGTVDSAVEAMKVGASDYILKPFRLSAILPVLQRALCLHQLRMENIQLRETVGVYDLSMALALTLDKNVILERLADAAFVQNQSHDVAILAASPDGSHLEVVAARGQDVRRLEGTRIPIDGAIASWEQASRACLAHPEGIVDLQTALRSPVTAIGAASAIPMTAGGKLVGILHLERTNPRHSIALGQAKAFYVLANAAAAGLEAASLLDQVRAAEQRYRRLAENAPDIIFRYELQPEARMAYVNPAITAITGYLPDEHHRDAALLLQMVHPEDRSEMDSALRGNCPSSARPIRLTHKNGASVWIEPRFVTVTDARGQPIAIEGIARDVTERRQLEEQLRQSQKMEAIGRLAGGIAHDFNNLLTVINGYASLVLGQIAADSPVYEPTEEIARAGEQATALTRQLLTFSRRQLLEPRVLDLNAVVADNVKILRRVIGEDIELIAALAPDLGPVIADPAQIEQILMNLAVNARDAMPRGGRLSISTANLVGEEVAAPNQVNGPSAGGVMLAVSDTGCGMDGTTLDRVFEPFFTTKAPGKGTGLGLSIVYGIVKQIGGSISVASGLGTGTTFRVCLPQVTGAASIPYMPLPRAQGASACETILLVEDDRAVRELVHQVIVGAGYRVLSARNGTEALQIGRERGAEIDLLLTDLVMPEMSGPELVNSLRELNPRICVMYMSGYADDAVTQHGCIDPGVCFIQKPFRPESLLAKVREAMQRTPGAVGL